MPSPVLHPSTLEARPSLGRNDPALVALLTAPDETRRRREPEALLLRSRPVVATVLSRFARREIHHPRVEDREDVESAVALRLRLPPPPGPPPQRQLAMLRSKGRAHPFYWASYIAVGRGLVT